MKIDVTMGDRRYGGFAYRNYHVRVTTNVGSSGATERAHGRARDLAFRRLKRALLGRRTPRTLKSRYSDAAIYAGEYISRLHLEKLEWDWDEIDFSGTPWAGTIRRLKDELRAKDFRRAAARRLVDVTIDFSLPGKKQQGGRVQMSLAAAQWLGRALLEASQGGTDDGGLSVNVRAERPRARRGGR